MLGSTPGEHWQLEARLDRMLHLAYQHGFERKLLYAGADPYRWAVQSKLVNMYAQRNQWPGADQSARGLRTLRPLPRVGPVT